MAINLCKLPAGDTTLTRRILKRCRDSGLQYREETKHVGSGRYQWKPKVVAYWVPAEIYHEEVSRREAEREAKRAKLAKRAHDSRIAEIKEKFARLSQDVVERLAKSDRSVRGPSEVGYQFKIATKSYWKQLSYRTTRDPTGYLVLGTRLFDLYSAIHLQEVGTRLTVDKLHEDWLNKYRSDQVVLAEAIRLANRLQKVKRVPDFYALKDKWLEHNKDCLIEGRIARREGGQCWQCYGEDDECPKCDGTGVYSSRTLYEHRILIEGREYSFHSYTKPKHLNPDGGLNLPAYGRPFKRSELPTPPQSVVVALARKLLSEQT